MTGWLNEATRAGGLPNVQFRRKPMMFYLEDTWKITPKLTMNIGLRYENTPPWHDKHSGYQNVYFAGCLGVDDTGIDENCPTPTLVRPEGINDDPFEGLAFHLADVVPVAVSDTLLYSRRLVRWDTNDFAPRIGISWAPDGKTTVRTGYGVFYAQDTANPVFDMGRNFGARDTARSFDEIPQVNFENGPWVNKTPGNCSNWDGACFNGLYTFGNDPGRSTPNVQQWVLNVQRQVTDTLMFEVGYMGSVGHNLQKMHGWNQPLLRAGPDDLIRRSRPPPLGRRCLRHHPDDLESGQLQLQRAGRQAAATQQQRPDVLVGLHLGEVDRRLFGDPHQRRRQPVPWQLLRLEQRARSFAVRYESAPDGVDSVRSAVAFRQRSVGSPGGRLAGRFDLHLLDRHAASTTAVAPATRPSAAAAARMRTASTRTSRADRKRSGARAPTDVRTPTTAAANSLGRPMDPTFPYRYGSSTRNDLTGPGYRNMDFSATKLFRINESMNMEFKFESYNATNHPNWNPPSTSLTSTQYGRITSARDMRINQFALKFNF